MGSRTIPPPKQQAGTALLVFFLLLFLAATFGLLHRSDQGERRRIQGHASHLALAQARDALIGYAATYRDRNPDEAFGYLPCPDTNNDGVAEPSCGVANETMVGRLPWKTLGLPPLADGSGECLWYVVAGVAKNNPKTDILNWDTPGAFIVQDASAVLLAGSAIHDRPWAAVIAPGPAIGNQSRPSASSGPCLGSNGATDYLEALAGLANPTPTLTLSTAQSAGEGSNNDEGVWIGSKEIYERVIQRNDFKSDIDTLLTDLSNCLNNLPQSNLPPASATNKGVGAYPTALANEVLAKCPPSPPLKQNLLRNWQDNLLYANPAGVNADPACKGALLFAGARSPGQIRAAGDPTQAALKKAAPANYLEGTNPAAFAAGGNVSGPAYFDKKAPSTDLARCITGLPPGVTQASFATDYAAFTPAGAIQAILTSPNETKVELLSAAGSTGGCFWFATPVPLAGRTLRAYYEFQFSYADTGALGSGSGDRGNGFTLQFVQSDLGLPDCGTESNLGTLQPKDGWLNSLIVETDIRFNAGNGDPAGNHTAIMINGNLKHQGSGSMSSACDGTASGCLHAPANRFEEAPLPLPHRQRVEIHSGCNSNCSACNPASHVAPNTWVNVAVWVDCADCSNVAADQDRVAAPLTIQRCVNLDGSLNISYAGITGGFLSGPGTAQGVTIRNFALRSELGP